MSLKNLTEFLVDVVDLLGVVALLVTCTVSGPEVVILHPLHRIELVVQFWSRMADLEES